MSDPKDFVAGIDSDARRSPTRVVFVTRRTSAQVKVAARTQVQTYPEVLFRAALAIELLAIALVVFSLFFNAPLEGIADPTHTPNPAKAPWYFLGLQELLHYFPPVVAGVLVPTLLIIALIVIPYFNINIEANGLFLKDRTKRLRIVLRCGPRNADLSAGFPRLRCRLAPTVLVALACSWPPTARRDSPSRLRRYLRQRPLAYWIMTWFLFELIVLTAVGTWFRGPGWSWVLPWRS